MLLSVQQVTGKFTPRLPNFTGEECIYSPHGPNVIDEDCGVYLRRKNFFDEKTWGRTVQICNCIRYGRVELSTDQIGGQIISPFPYFFDYQYPNNNLQFRSSRLKVGKNLEVINDEGHLLVSSDKIGTRCFLKIYDRENSLNPVAVARLDFTTEKKADVILSREKEHQKHMERFLSQKGWVDRR